MTVGGLIELLQKFDEQQELLVDGGHSLHDINDIYEDSIDDIVYLTLTRLT